EAPGAGHALVGTGIEAGGVDLVAGVDAGGDVPPLAVPRPGHGTWAAGGHHAHGLALARHHLETARHLDVRRVIHHPEADGVEVGRLPQLLGDAQAIDAVD